MLEALTINRVLPGIVSSPSPNLAIIFSEKSPSLLSLDLFFIENNIFHVKTMCVYICIYIYTYISIHTHTYTYIISFQFHGNCIIRSIFLVITLVKKQNLKKQGSEARFFAFRFWVSLATASLMCLGGRQGRNACCAQSRRGWSPLAFGPLVSNTAIR